MDRFEKEFLLTALIQKQLTETISEQERQSLEDWLKEAENRAFYDRMMRKEMLQKKQKVYSTIDTESAYARVMQQIPANRHVWIRVWMRYAAILMLGFGIVLIGLWLKSAISSNHEGMTARLQPGYERASLVLETGEIVQLEKGKDRMIDQEGMVSSLDNVLIYNPEIVARKGASVMNRLEVPVGGIYAVHLSDGTKVWLNSQSSLEFPIMFNGAHRVVRLKGEAYFQVSKNPLKPFMVETAYGVTKVLGTSFNVCAYEEDNKFSVTLTEGVVQVADFTGPLVADQLPVLLKPGQQVSYQDQDKEVAIREVDPHVTSAWTEGKFYFENESLKDILVKISRWYGVKIKFDNPGLQTITFTGVARKDKSLDYLMNLISETSQIQYTINQKKDAYEITIAKK